MVQLSSRWGSGRSAAFFTRNWASTRGSAGAKAGDDLSPGLDIVPLAGLLDEPSTAREPPGEGWCGRQISTVELPYVGPPSVRFSTNSLPPNDHHPPTCTLSSRPCSNPTSPHCFPAVTGVVASGKCQPSTAGRHCCVDSAELSTHVTRTRIESNSGGPTDGRRAAKNVIPGPGLASALQSELVRFAESESTTLCVSCGDEGKAVVADGHFTTLCRECVDAELAEGYRFRDVPW
uniref:DksA C4-type domain-containing protein n=1 Tax=Mycena chlorophos TaxID=658473 RepID=A0ABQ0MDL6_MYCCL|nr:predicted protein [Mycena chlorophos]